MPQQRTQSLPPLLLSKENYMPAIRACENVNVSAPARNTVITCELPCPFLSLACDISALFIRHWPQPFGSGSTINVSCIAVANLLRKRLQTWSPSHGHYMIYLRQLSLVNLAAMLPRLATLRWGTNSFGRWGSIQSSSRPALGMVSEVFQVPLVRI